MTEEDFDSLSPQQRQQRWEDHYERIHGHKQGEPHSELCRPTDDRGRPVRR